MDGSYMELIYHSSLESYLTNNLSVYLSSSEHFQ